MKNVIAVTPSVIVIHAAVELIVQEQDVPADASAANKTRESLGSPLFYILIHVHQFLKGTFNKLELA